MTSRTISPETSPATCPLCRLASPTRFFEDTRTYFLCNRCELVFLASHQRPTRDAEKAHYQLHENSPDDVAYRRFLGRLLAPLARRLPPASTGLDFGCGPGPTASVMLEELGHSMSIYDPFFHPDRSCLEFNYDFITATEVLEHLHHPGPTLDFLWKHLRPGGLFGVMTKRRAEPERFATWHYRYDPTHVCFFAEQTLRWLAARWEAKVSFPESDVTIFEKPPESHE